MMRRADLVVYSPDGSIQLVVEVKNKRDASIEWVIQMRRNLLVHSLIPASPYFLLALPDYFYLWVNSQTEPIDAPPDYEIDATEALASYVGRSNLSLAEVSEYGLEILVVSWLHELLNADLYGSVKRPTLNWFLDSGLYEAIKHGSVETEVVV